MTIPQLPAWWTETILGEVIERVTKWTTPKSFSLNNNDINYVKSESLSYDGLLDKSKIVKISMETHKELKRSQLKENDILLSMAGMFLGKTALVSSDLLPANTNQAVAIITANSNIINYIFLWYKLRNKQTIQYFNSIPSQSAQPNINFEEIKSLPISLPPLPEQQAIASLLSSFDDKIELLREQNKTLKTIGQTIFQEWFGKYSVDDPESLPDGWRVWSLSEIAEFLNGIALQKFPAENENEYLPVIKIRELKAGITSQTDKASKNIDPKYIIDNGDILFSWSWSLEVVIWQNWKWALNQHLFKVTSQEYPKRFYYFWTLYHLPEFREIASHKATTMWHIQRHHLDNAQVIIPNETDMEKLNWTFSNILDKLENNNLQIQSLSTSRDTLLPKLMSGEVRVEF